MKYLLHYHFYFDMIIIIFVLFVSVIWTASASQDLIDAAGNGMLDEVKKLVESGADVNYQDYVSEFILNLLLS